MYVKLDYIDISEYLKDNFHIESEEGTAKVTEFTTMPFSGPISVSNWIGKPVQIEYALQDADGNLIERHLLFQGVVDEPIYDPTTRLTTFTCTDQLQERVESLSRNEINNLIRGYWDSVLFDEGADNWTYARDQLSTVPASLDLDKEDHFKLTSWQSKAEPDFVFTEDDILYQQTKVQIANRRSLHNQVNIQVQYRYQRLKQRELAYQYRYPLSLCDQLTQGATMPNVEMIQQAVSGTGWGLKGKVDFVNQHPSGVVYCNGVKTAFSIREELRKYLAREASFTLTKRFNQTVTECYRFQLEAPQSIEQIGQIMHKTGASLEVEADVDAFKADNENGLLEGSLKDEQGDRVLEVEDRAHLQNVTATLLNQARTGVLEAHRQNLVTFKTLLQPQLERHHTVLLDTPEVKAQGKVKHIIHECDFNEGSCLTTVTLAVSRTDSEIEVDEGALELPAKVAKLGNPKIHSEVVDLPTRFGGDKASETFDNNWEGYTGNLHLPPGAEAYPERFSVATPAIEDAQAPVTYPFSYSYQISIPNELLALSA